MARKQTPQLQVPPAAQRSPDGHRTAGRDGALPPLPRQRRRRMLIYGLLLIVAGALTAGYLFTGMSDRTAVVMVTRDVPIGTQITAADIATTRVATDTGVSVIPGSQLDQVAGRFAAVDLRKGTLLAPSEVTTQLPPRQGEQVVPVAVKVAQLPARGLRPGDQVLVIATPSQQAGQGEATGGTGSSPLGQDTPATVDQVSSPDADGNVRVDLVVDASSGPAIARQASTGRIGFVITPRGPR